MTIRVGEGQTPSGKILDGGTHWYTYNKKERYIADERLAAIQYAQNTLRNIYVSSGKRSYLKVTVKQLMNM
jgi:hypothetical protein